MNDRTLGRLVRRYYTSSDGSITPPGEKITIRELPSAHSGHTLKVQPLLDGPKQWSTWSGRIKWYFKSHGVKGYVNGTITPPDPRLDSESANNWRTNNAHACSIIVTNIARLQLIHTNPCNTLHEMWEALRSVHEQHGHQTAINYIRILFKSSISEDGDIPQHLNMVKDTWEMVNILSGVHFKFSDQFFKLIIASSLPPLWDAFTDQYMGSETDIYSYDPKQNMPS
jgi:gag-polypeptide of LTR copia-type